MKTRTRDDKSAFTLLELLVVIGIIALLATIGVGALRGFNAVNVVQAGNRQLIDDINMARNHALNQRTTVYMVFVPSLEGFDLTKLGTNELAKKQVFNRVPGQFSSYNFLTLHSAGDQPGRGKARYLGEWKQLPEGVFIVPQKFDVLRGTDWMRLATSGAQHDTSFLPFVRFPSVPFPSGSSAIVDTNGLPCIAFNFRGGLVGPDPNTPRQADEIVVLTRGSLINSKDASGRYKLEVPEIIETPRSNWLMNPRIRIDWVTGRPRIEDPKVYFSTI